MKTQASGSKSMDWDDPRWNSPMPHARLRLSLAILLAVLLVGGLVAGGRWFYDRYAPHHGPTPTMVSHRSKLPSCGHYYVPWSQIPTPISHRPSAAVLQANHCLSAAFYAGRPAELTVSGGPDDIQHTSKTFYRVVGLHRMEIIWEDIPKEGPIQASKLSDCATLTDVNGQIGADNCHPPYPTYG